MLGLVEYNRSFSPPSPFTFPLPNKGKMLLGIADAKDICRRFAH